MIYLQPSVVEEVAAKKEMVAPAGGLSSFYFAAVVETAVVALAANSHPSM